MNIQNTDKIVYQLTIEDLLTVAKETLDRELTEQEIQVLEEKIGDHIDWYGAIQSAIWQNIENSESDDNRE